MQFVNLALEASRSAFVHLPNCEEQCGDKYVEHQCCKYAFWKECNVKVLEEITPDLRISLVSPSQTLEGGPVFVRGLRIELILRCRLGHGLDWAHI